MNQPTLAFFTLFAVLISAALSMYHGACYRYALINRWEPGRHKQKQRFWMVGSAILAWVFFVMLETMR